MDIKETKTVEPLSASIAEAMPPAPVVDVTPKASSPPQQEPQPQLHPHRSSDSSTSTGHFSSVASDKSSTMHLDSDTSVSSSSLTKSRSVVRGFSPSQVSSSYRSNTHLAAPATAIAMRSPQQKHEAPKKSAMFTLGGSSGEEESSFEDRMSVKPRSSLSEGLRRPTVGKQTSFKDVVESNTIREGMHEDSEAAIESDEDVSESAIDDDDDDEDWEDSPTESRSSSVDQKQIFKRVESRPNLVSRRSLLTTLMHEPQRAAALANAASRSTPAMRRSRTSSPSGPSMASSPEDGQPLELKANPTAIPRTRPLAMAVDTYLPSPRTSRRNMLADELTSSLRQHLLWERQQKSTTFAAFKRRHTTQDMANLKQYPEPPREGSREQKNESWNHYFEAGLGEYHQRGW